MKIKPLAYDYEHFLLADTSDFGYQQEILSNDGRIGFNYDEQRYRLRLEKLLRDIAQIHHAELLQKRRQEGKYIQIFAESKRFVLGIDTSGIRPAIFVRAKIYCRSRKMIKCRIKSEVKKAFRRLIELYPTLWSYPSSVCSAFNVAWISDDGIPVSQRSDRRF